MEAIRLFFQRAIENRGVKLSYIAKKIGLSVDLLSKSINGKRRLNADEFLRICKVLGVYKIHAAAGGIDPRSGGNDRRRRVRIPRTWVFTVGGEWLMPAVVIAARTVWQEVKRLIAVLKGDGNE